jgi:hypothetical protein
MPNVVPLRRLLRTARTSGPDITDGVTSMLAESSSTRRIGALPALCQAKRRILSHDCIQATTDIVVD